MRHAKQSQRLSMPSDQKLALVNGLLKSLIEHDKIQTTFTRAKVAQPEAERLITMGKENTVHSRRQAFRVLQDRKLVKRLFDDIAPRFADVQGGYTRVVRVKVRKGDGATVAQLAFSRIPEIVEKVAPKKSAASATSESSTEPAGQGKKGILEGLRDRLGKGKKGE